MSLSRFLGLILVLGASPGASAEAVWVGRFSEGDTSIPAPWKLERLSAKHPPSRYALRRWDGVVAIEAHADKSMALLGRPVAVDLTKTPILCWQWRIDAPVASAGVKRACSWPDPGVADPGS